MRSVPTSVWIVFCSSAFTLFITSFFYTYVVREPRLYVTQDTELHSQGGSNSSINIPNQRPGTTVRPGPTAKPTPYHLRPRLTLPPFVFEVPEPQENKNKDVFIRAVLMYLPSDNDGGQFAKQLMWLHRSWQEMLKTQSKSWRTDIYVITNKHIPVYDYLKCTKINRLSPEEPDKCIYADGYNADIPDFKDYTPVHSINCLLHPTANFTAYDYILRTDIDTFLTPAFSTWKPTHMMVGGGGYIQGDQLLTSHRLSRIADYLRLNYKDMNNIGSTWYGPVYLMQKAAALSVEVMRYLKKHEFTQLEMSPKFGIQGWPEWHYGVLTMYGGHLAINHLATMNTIEIASSKLDFYSTSLEPVINHPHIHTWHTEEVFSKFVFLAGGYKDINLTSLSIKTCKDYCLFMALDSRRLMDESAGKVS